MQHRAAVRAGPQPLRRARDQFPVFLRTQDDVREVLDGVRGFPRRFGTMDELFEALTLIQTGKVRHFPVILFGAAYWKGMTAWLRERGVGERKIASTDLALLHTTDTAHEAVSVIRQARARRNRELPVLHRDGSR